MPKRYLAIKESLSKEHPEMPLKERESEAARIFNSTRKPHEASLQTTIARERRKKVTGRWR